MKYLSKFAGVYVAYLLQVLLIENIKILGCSPNIILPVLVVYAVSHSFSRSAVLGGFAGLLLDSLEGSVFGINILIYMYFSLAVSLLVDKKTENSPLIVGFVSFVSISAMEIILTVVKSVIGYSNPIGYLFAKILVKGVFGGVIALLIVWLSQKRMARRENRQEHKKEGNL